MIIQRVKLSFSLQYKSIAGNLGPVWQHRYWDHIIRDEQDFKAHLDYIHYNPVKHGLVDSPASWEWSSFRFFQKKGYYSHDWGSRDLDFGVCSFGE